MDFETAFNKLIGFEGGYSNNPNDAGGETNWGITKAVAVANGYTGAMKDMTKDQAKPIYKSKYWDAVKADQMPNAVKYPLFDAAVNSGTTQAVKWLQAALGVSVDGVIGAVTIAKANQSDGAAVASAMLSQRLNFLTGLSVWPTFGKGWARRIASMMAEIGAA